MKARGEPRTIIVRAACDLWAPIWRHKGEMFLVSQSEREALIHRGVVIDHQTTVPVQAPKVQRGFQSTPERARFRRSQILARHRMGQKQKDIASLIGSSSAFVWQLIQKAKREDQAEFDFRTCANYLAELRRVIIEELP